MAETVTIKQVYRELKQIEQHMATKEELRRILDTVEILSNPVTMEQIMRSENDIRAGKVKEVKSVRDI